MKDKSTTKTWFKNSYIIVILFIGWNTIVLGAVGTINLTLWGRMLLNYGLIIQSFGCVLGILKVFQLKSDENKRIESKRFRLENKYILLIILIGASISSWGALGKINSMDWGSYLLQAGSLILIFGYVLGIKRLLTIKILQDFLRS